MLIQRQVEAWRAGADIGHIVIDALMLVDQPFQAFDLCLGGAQRGALAQFEVDHQFQTSGGRKELLGHETEQQDRADKQRQGQHDYRLAPPHTPLHRSAHPLVERRCIGVITLIAAAMLGRVQLGQVRQQLGAQVRHEDYRGDPRHQQGDGHHLEDRTGVLAGARLRGGNRQEARGRDQGAGEHGKGRTGPGVTGRLEAVETLLHFDRHHLHGDDRIVHQQAEGQHQGAEGDFVQADAQVVHGGEGHRQHQRNRQRHHQAGAQAEGEETHQQDDDQRLGEHLDELADPGFHRRRLIRHLAQLHAGRQGFLQSGELAFQRLTQHQDVATTFHRHRQANGVLTHEAHARCGWVVEAARNLGHIADAEGAIGYPNRKIANLLDRLETPGDPQLHAIRTGLEEAGRRHRVLLIQRLLHHAQR